MRPNLKQILCLLLLLVLQPPPAVNGQALPHPEPEPAASEFQPSVVMVVGYNKKTGSHQQATGFFINQAGDVVTNYHVIDGIADIKIWTEAHGGFPVTKIIAADLPADLAIMAVDIPGRHVHPATLAKQLPSPGEAVEVVGHPLGHQQTSAKGVIASIFPAPRIDTLLQFTAPIAVGGSGSPLFNKSGQVVGVASFIIYLGANKEPRYFAIPTTRLLRLNQLSRLSHSPARQQEIGYISPPLWNKSE